MVKSRTSSLPNDLWNIICQFLHASVMITTVNMDQRLKIHSPKASLSTICTRIVTSVMAASPYQLNPSFYRCFSDRHR